MLDLGQAIMRGFALGFGFPEGYFAPHYARSFWCMRIIRCVGFGGFRFGSYVFMCVTWRWGVWGLGHTHTFIFVTGALFAYLTKTHTCIFSYPPVSLEERETLSSGMGCGEVNFN
jgi:hypothetical protein